MDYSESYSLFDVYGNRKYLNTTERAKFFTSCQQVSIEESLYPLMVYYTGARPSEVLNIQIRHLDFEEKVVTIKSLKKRGKIQFRQISLPKKYLDDLKLWISNQNKNKDGKVWDFSYRTGYRRIKKLMALAKISDGPKASPKGLRHGFAIACVLHDIPLPLVQKWMGHASINTTAIYLNVIGKEERVFAKRLWGGD